MNLKRFLTFTQRALLAVVLITTIGITGCDNDDDDNGPQIFEGDVLALIKDDQFKQSATVPATEALDSLVKYIEAYGVSSLLTVSGGEVTLFAPSNQAFVNLLTTTPGFPSDITVISPNIIAGVLAYHTVNGTKLKADLTSGTTLNTNFSQPDNCNPSGDAEVQTIVVNSNGTLLTGSTNDQIEIVSYDNKATNGVVHIVGSVMIPPSVGEKLQPILTTVAAPAFLSSDFSILAGLITYADCAITNPSTTPPISNILANPAGTLTVFFTPDAVFSQLGYGDTAAEVIASLAADGYDTPAKLRGLILGHVIGASLDAAALEAKDGQTIQSLTGADIAISLHPTNGMILLNGTIPVIMPDADLSRDNGVMHAIGGVIE
jgi:uncharacterized surface protein with fasciclin (FAS1) repeats